MSNWIVHPFSFQEKGHREISVVRKNNIHGLRSYGWFGENKIFIAKDTMYGDLHEKAYDAVLIVAKDLAEQLNEANKQIPNIEDPDASLREFAKNININRADLT